MVGQTEQSNFSLGEVKPHRQTTIGQQTRRAGLRLAISLVLALFVALALPAATFAAGSNTVAVVRSSGADLYDAPDGAAIQSLARGSALDAIGRTADGAWLKVTTADGKTGWTPAARLVVFAVENLPALSDAQANRHSRRLWLAAVAITSSTSDHRHRDHRRRIAEPARAGPARITRSSAPARPERPSRLPVETSQRTGWPWLCRMGRISAGFHPVSCARRAIRRGCPSRIG